jgi:hypothetical protein
MFASLHLRTTQHTLMILLNVLPLKQIRANPDEIYGKGVAGIILRQFNAKVYICVLSISFSHGQSPPNDESTITIYK